jgi:hypothetical protein
MIKSPENAFSQQRKFSLKYVGENRQRIRQIHHIQTQRIQKHQPVSTQTPLLAARQLK